MNFTMSSKKKKLKLRKRKKNLKKQRKNKTKNQLKRNRKRSNTVSSTSVPLMTGYDIKINNPMKKHSVRHTEYIRDIILGEDQSKPNLIESVNPGDQSVFPWLAGIAQKFETYHFNSLTFFFVPLVAADTDGAVVLFPDYDPDDDNSNLDKKEILAFDDCVRGPVWKRIVMGCSRNNLNKGTKLYVALPHESRSEKKLYDNLSVGVLTTGVETTYVGKAIGELWVSYDVTFDTPQMGGQVHVDASLQSHERSTNSQRWFPINGTSKLKKAGADIIETVKDNADAFIIKTGGSPMRLFVNFLAKIAPSIVAGSLHAFGISPWYKNSARKKMYKNKKPQNKYNITELSYNFCNENPLYADTYATYRPEFSVYIEVPDNMDGVLVELGPWDDPTQSFGLQMNEALVTINQIDDITVKLDDHETSYDVDKDVKKGKKQAIKACAMVEEKLDKKPSKDEITAYLAKYKEQLSQI